MRLRQVRPAAAALPHIASWGPLAFAAAAGLVLIALGGGGPDGVVLELRLAGASVAATTAWLLDDPAAATLASSPTTLLARRGIRMAAGSASVALWWAVAVTVADVRAHHLPVPALTREVAVLSALAALASIAAQRWSSEGWGGSAGAFLAVWWFAMSFLPSLGGLPLPPQPLQPGSAAPLLVVTGAALSLALLLSRDPAGGHLR